MTAEQHHSAAADGEVYRPAFPRGYPHISYGISFPKACLKHVTGFKASRVYIIASASLSRNTDYVKQLQQILGDKVVGTRHGMKPHTLWSELLEIAKEAADLNADLLITLGAGSLTDGAKVIALAMANSAFDFSALDKLHSGSNWLEKRPDLNPPKVPIISIPTSLSGGEYSFLGGATNDKTHLKHGFGHPTVGPALVVLDPQLTTTTPASIWLQSGVRAIDHCVEGLCSLSSTPASDASAEKGLRRLAPGLLKCHENSKDVDARLACQMGVIDAMAVVFQHGVPMGASHGIGHQLGPLGVGHGETSCVLLPAVCKYNVSVNRGRQEKVKKIFWADEEVATTLRQKEVKEEDELGVVLDVYIRALGMPRSLKDVAVGDDKLDSLAKNSLEDRWCGTNPRPLKSEADVLEILEMVRGFSTGLAHEALEENSNQVRADYALYQSSLQAYNEANDLAIAADENYTAANPKFQAFLDEHITELDLRVTQLYNTMCRVLNQYHSRLALRADLTAAYEAATARLDELNGPEPVDEDEDDEEDGDEDEGGIDDEEMEGQGVWMTSRPDLEGQP